MASEFKNFIAGDWVAPSTGEYFENRNPADWNDVIGRFPRSGPDDLKRAIASAHRGRRADHAVQLPARDTHLEDVSRAAVRKRGRLQACGGCAAHRASPGRGAARGGVAARSRAARSWAGLRRGTRPGRAS